MIAREQGAGLVDLPRGHDIARVENLPLASRPIDQLKAVGAD